MRRVLDLLDEESPEEEELIDALQDLQDLHEFERQWALWPARVREVLPSAYNRGMFQLMRGVLRCVERGGAGVRAAAVDLLYALCVGGCNLTRAPPSFVIECGAVPVLCAAARETSDRTVLQLMTELSRHSPSERLQSVLIEGGAIEAAVRTLEEVGFTPMDQLAGLDLILSLAKRAPRKTAESGAYEFVKVVSNEALVPRRNKIMNFLRPIVEEDRAQPSEEDIGTDDLKP